MSNPHFERVLANLTKVRGRNGNYVACCPAHDDKSPSMTIRETPDGKILMHCFSGCSIAEITGAIGVDLSDLFPPTTDAPDYSRSKHSSRPTRPRFMASDLLKVIAFEATIVAVCAYDMAQGRALKQEDMARLKVASSRIADALEANNG